MKLKPLLIMVAPNGARRTKADHPALPMTADELAETARQCLAAGAAAIHVHVRDASGRHTLDAALYRDAIAAIRERTQGVMAIQITTEAVGLYSPREQMDLVRALHPVSVSIGLREIISDGEAEPARFFAWAGREGIAVQHILYDRADLDRFIDLRRRGILTEPTTPRLLFVLGRYAADQESRPEDLDVFLEGLDAHGLEGAVWSVCAFGRGETLALTAAIAAGGHVRVGFENSLWHADGSLARDNAERVAAIVEAAGRTGRSIASAAQAFDILGIARQQ
ncbi:3-keto-5-aminohexanoate cleavage protein [Mesorhizobium sp. BR1-1-2]|uniref:3-keto-5-aminohexanoate cleavage protein n=1 Tax=Mesorhizobium sp. BR1-1-2 TaxID=2876652 RepID=UPI00398CC798